MNADELRVAVAMAAALRDSGHDGDDPVAVADCPGCSALADYDALRATPATGAPSAAVAQVLAAWDRLQRWESGWLVVDPSPGVTTTAWTPEHLPRFFWTAMDRLRDETTVDPEPRP